MDAHAKFNQCSSTSRLISMAPSLQRLERFGPLEATSISSVPSSTTCVWQQLECLNSAAAASGSWMNLHRVLSWHLRSLLGVAQQIFFFSPLGGVRDLQKVWDWSGSEVIRFSWWDGAVRILRPALWSWFLPGWWWLEPWNFMTFQKQLGIIYNPNCYSLIFLRRVVKNHQPVTHGGHVCRGTTSPAHKSRCGFRLSTEC